MKPRKLLGLTLFGMMIISMSLSATTIGSLTRDIEVKTSEDEIITKQKGEMVEVLEKLADKYTVEVEDDVPYELNSDLIKVEGTLTKTISEETKLRKAPDENAEITMTFNKEVPVFVLEGVDNWYSVKIEGLTGYIYKSQIDESELHLVPYTKTEVKAEPKKEEKGKEVVTYAKQFLGNPYVYGGNSLTSGVDCSGFTSQIYKHFGLQLQRSSRAQYSSNGYKVTKSEIKEGDLVFYGNNGVINHVAIYAGNGEIIHANDAKTGIKMSKLEYGKPMIGIKRIIK